MIVIAGGGIAGLATALGLSPFSDVLVLERRGVLASNEGAGIQLSPNAMKALRLLGVEEAVAAVAHRPTGLDIRAGTRAVSRVSYDDAFEARFGAPSLTTARAALHRALLDAALAHPRVTLVGDRPVERFRLENGVWTLPGFGGALSEANWLVAADGVNSAVRREVVGDAPTDTGWIAWRGKGPALRRGSSTTLAMAPGAHLVRYALDEAGNQSANIVYIAQANAGAPGQREGPLSRELAEVSDWVPWPIKVRERHIFRYPSMPLVGDASHAMHPFLAQGAAMALEDAAVLSLAVSAHGFGEAALTAYANARIPRVRRVARQSERQGGIYHLAPPFSFARDVVMGRLGAEGVLSRVAWLYGFTPAVEA